MLYYPHLFILFYALFEHLPDKLKTLFGYGFPRMSESTMLTYLSQIAMALIIKLIKTDVDIDVTETYAYEIG